MAEKSSDPLDDIDAASGSLSEDDLSTLRTALEDENPNNRREAARLVSVAAGANAEDVRPLIEDLAPLLEAERVSISKHAGMALLTIAPDYREELVDVVPEIVTLATHDVNGPRMLGANLLATVVVEYPEAASEDVHRLLPVLQEETGPYQPSEAVEQVDNPETRESIMDQEQGEHRMKLESLGTIANVVVAVAEADPSGLFDHVDAVVELVNHDDPVIAGAAIDVIAEIARVDPDVAAPAFEDLVASLDREDGRIRARSIRALGFVEDERASEPLSDLAESTDDEDLAELASETSAFLESD